MADSRCVKCSGTRFEMVENQPAGSKVKVFFVQCAACGGVVGALDLYAVGDIVKRTAATVKQIAERLEVRLRPGPGSDGIRAHRQASSREGWRLHLPTLAALGGMTGGTPGGGTTGTGGVKPGADSITINFMSRSFSRQSATFLV